MIQQQRIIEERIGTSEEEASDAELFSDEREFESEFIGNSKILNNQMSRSTTIEMIDSEVLENTVIYGRTTKTKPKSPFGWSSTPAKTFTSYAGQLEAHIIDDLKDEKSIIVFFKMIITEKIVKLVVKYTNSRISLIDNSKIVNWKYKKKCERIKNIRVSEEEMFSFIGLFILFGLTGKSDVSIEVKVKVKEE